MNILPPDLPPSKIPKAKYPDIDKLAKNITRLPISNMIRIGAAGFAVVLAGLANSLLYPYPQYNSYAWGITIAAGLIAIYQIVVVLITCIKEE